MAPQKQRKRSKDVIVLVDPWWGDTEAASAAERAAAAQCRRATLLVCGGTEGGRAEVTLRATLRPAQRLSVEYVPLPDPALLLPPPPSGSSGAAVDDSDIDDEAVVAAYAAQVEAPLARAMWSRDGDGDGDGSDSRTVVVLCSSLLRSRLAVAASASAAVSGGGDVAAAAAWLRRRAAAASALLGSVLQAYGGALPLVPHLPRVLRAVARCGGGDGGGFVGVEAGTGTGKSTLLPQAIVAAKAVRGAGGGASTVRVAVAMPRRAAVLGVCAVVRAAARARASPLCAAAGRVYSCGVQAGYRVGGQQEGAEEANVLYTTTGSLLKELIAGVQVEEGGGCRGRRRPTLRTAYTHIVVDECHVASAETELLRELLFRCCGGGGGTRGGPVVILMSATFRTSAYLSARFGPVGDDGDDHRGSSSSSRSDDDDEGRHPLLVLPSATPYPVTVRHLDTVLAGLEAGDSGGDGGGDGGGAASTPPPPLHRLCLLSAWVARCVRAGSSVLVFLPGLAAIRQVGCGVEDAAREAGAEVISVHGALQGGRERLARRAALAAAATLPPLPPVVVLATNSVELGVTLPELDVVVDSCLERVAAGGGGGCGGGRLETRLVPRAALRQRAGRVGRCRAGTVYRLVTADEEAALDEEASAALEGGGVTEAVVLDALAFSLAAGAGDAAESAEGLLGGATCAEAVEQAVARLEACGAVVSDRRGGGRCRHRVTSEGLLFQRLPLDPALSHFVLLGARLGRFSLCAEAAAAAACGVFRAARDAASGAAATLSPHRMCDGSHSDVVGGVNMLRAHLRRRRLRREGGGDDGSDEGAEEEEEEGSLSAAEALRNAECRLRDVAAVFLEAEPEALSFEYEAEACDSPVVYEDMLALSFLWSAAFVSKTAAFKAKDMVCGFFFAAPAYPQCTHTHTDLTHAPLPQRRREAPLRHLPRLEDHRRRAAPRRQRRRRRRRRGGRGAHGQRGAPRAAALRRRGRARRRVRGAGHAPRDDVGPPAQHVGRRAGVRGPHGAPGQPAPAVRAAGGRRRGRAAVLRTRCAAGGGLGAAGVLASRGAGGGGAARGGVQRARQRRAAAERAGDAVGGAAADAAAGGPAHGCARVGGGRAGRRWCGGGRRREQGAVGGLREAAGCAADGGVPAAARGRGGEAAGGGGGRRRRAARGRVGRAAGAAAGGVRAAGQGEAGVLRHGVGASTRRGASCDVQPRPWRSRWRRGGRWRWCRRRRVGVGALL